MNAVGVADAKNVAIFAQDDINKILYNGCHLKYLQSKLV